MADCSATTADAALAPAAETPVVGWPAAARATRPDVAYMQSELEQSWMAFSAAHKLQDTIPPPEVGSPLDVSYLVAMKRHSAAVRTWLDFEPRMPSELVIKAQALLSAAADGAIENAPNHFEMICRQIVRIIGGAASVASEPLQQPVVRASRETCRAWRPRRATFDRARVAVDSAEEVAYAFEQAADAEAPPPEDLRRRAGDGPDAFYVDVEEIWRNDNLDFGEKLRLLKLFDQHLVECRAASEKHRCEQAEEELSLRALEYKEAANALLRTPAPDAHAVLTKLRIYAARTLDTVPRYRDLDDDTVIAQLLTSPDVEEWGMAHLLQDVLRITQPASPLIDVQAFDAAAWVEAYEREPHHEVTRYGIGWNDPDYDLPFTVTDPRVVAAYHARCSGLDAFVEAELSDSERSANGFIIGNRGMIAEVYAGDDVRVAELERMWDERNHAHAENSAKVAALLPWQRKAVREFARQRAAEAA